MDRTLTYLIVVVLAGLWGTKISAQPNAHPHPSPKNILQASLAAVGKNTDRNKVKNLDPALGDCYKIKGKLPERMCKVPMKVSSSSCFWMRFHYIDRPQNDILFVWWGV